MPSGSPLKVQPVPSAQEVAAETAAMDERALVAAVLRRDRKATAELVARYGDALYAYARQRLAPRADLVDDLVQDVLVAALRGLHGFAGQSRLEAWLLGIARHKVEDLYRARLRSLSMLSDLDEDAVPTPASVPRLDEQIDQRRLRDKTRRILAQLPEAYGLALLWRYWEKRSVKDMAVQTGKTEKALERLLARARADFKRRWEAD